MGGNEQSTHKYVSELLGKATIDTNTYGKSRGHSGSYTTNYQNAGRELLDAAEVRLLDNEKAILFLRGERPVLDDKYDILKHPNVALTTDGTAPPYLHGGTEHAVATLSLTYLRSGEAEQTPEDTETTYELLSDEELEEIYQTEEIPNE